MQIIIEIIIKILIILSDIAYLVLYFGTISCHASIKPNNINAKAANGVFVLKYGENT